MFRRRPISRLSAKRCKSSAGTMAAASVSTNGGAEPTPLASAPMRRSSWASIRMQSWSALHWRCSPCNRRPAASRSFLLGLSIPSRPASLPAWRARAATSPASLRPNLRCSGNCWTCSRSSRLVSRAWRLFLIRTRPRRRGYFAPTKRRAVQGDAGPARESRGPRRVPQRCWREPNSGLVVLPNPVTDGSRKLILAMVARRRVPAAYGYRHFVADGGLISYGVDLAEQYRQAASYVDRILRGEKPGDLPVQAPTKYELVINLRTAKELDIDVAATLIARADEVIE